MLCLKFLICIGPMCHMAYRHYSPCFLFVRRGLCPVVQCICLMMMNRCYISVSDIFVFIIIIFFWSLWTINYLTYLTTIFCQQFCSCLWLRSTLYADWSSKLFYYFSFKFHQNLSNKFAIVKKHHHLSICVFVNCSSLQCVPCGLSLYLWVWRIAGGGSSQSGQYSHCSPHLS